MALRRHRIPSYLLSALSAIGALWAGSAAAAAETVDVTYALSLIGLPLGEAKAEATVEPTKYSVRLEAKLVGVASLVSSARSAATSSGAIVGGKVAPTSYATAEVGSRSGRTVRMGMDEGTVRAVSIEPPMKSAPDRIPVTAEEQRNIVDPVSALVMTVPPNEPMVGPAACNRTLPVFDGFARFDVKLTFVGSRRMKIRGFDGPVSVCAARYIPVAGHRPGTSGVVFMQNNKRLEVWLAPLGSARVELPLRISVATQVGATVAEATDFDVRQDSTGSAEATRRPLDSKNERSPFDKSSATLGRSAVSGSLDKK
jgi:hypothetical protein